MNSARQGSAVLLSVRQDIASMKTRGAGEIGKQAALALAGAAESFQGNDVKRLRADLVEAAKLLSQARPTAVSLRNALNFVLTETMDETSVPGAKGKTRERAEAFAKRVNEAKGEIAKRGAALLKDGQAILTHCHSTAAAGALIEAVRQGKRLRVFSTETRPFRQGLITSRMLRGAGVDVTLIVDSAALHVLESERVAAMVIGADAIDADGSLYNKIGTRLITLAARSLKVPVYVCAETYKFSPYSLEGEEVAIEVRAPAEIVDPKQLPGVKVHNPVFDKTPPGQVSKYVTERGLLAPRSVAAFIRKEFGGAKRWI
ncbi:MAG: S-methyl-5-thioribose-1-phosphate isomerase [Euryarchaeota archaeon]|nr:S-methyl-5-thioribose-1-phosphate isomerase [Euryarchaeota archaeon]